MAPNGTGPGPTTEGGGLHPKHWRSREKRADQRAWKAYSYDLHAGVWGIRLHTFVSVADCEIQVKEDENEKGITS